MNIRAIAVQTQTSNTNSNINTSDSSDSSGTSEMKDVLYRTKPKNSVKTINDFIKQMPQNNHNTGECAIIGTASVFSGNLYCYATFSDNYFMYLAKAGLKSVFAVVLS